MLERVVEILRKIWPVRMRMVWCALMLPATPALSAQGQQQPSDSQQAQTVWSRSSSFGEQSLTYLEQPPARIHVNAPALEAGAEPRATRLIVYALPNGNTIEQTLGCQLFAGMDWHFDIQHVAAQIRLLRALEPQERIVLIIAEASGLSWPDWRRTQPDAHAAIGRMLESWRNRFGTADSKVTLTGHSGGGSFMFGVLEATEEIPAYVDRIAFLDANYAFEAPLHAAKCERWLKGEKSRRLIVLSYDDREIMLDGKKVVGPTGGTFRATERMHAALRTYFPLATRDKSPFRETIGLNERIHFYVHSNPENKILHTALVGDMNGLVHALTLGTPLASKWGTFGGPRAYTKWIQQEPARLFVETPTDFRAMLPPRPVGAVGGAEFVKSVHAHSLDEREAAILREISSGNFPEFLRKLKKVPIRGIVRDRDGTREREFVAALHVMPDYLAIGSDADFVRLPMTPQTAQQIADHFGCLLPTRKIVDAIDQHAELHLEPRPLANEREAVATFHEHHRIIEEQRAGKSLGLLTIGIKKDIVLSPRDFEQPQRLAIYGWRRLDGKPIQPLTIVHGNCYVDYSHGVRLVLNEIEIDGRPVKITELLADPNRCGLVSDEGPMNPPAYPAE